MRIVPVAQHPLQHVEIAVARYFLEKASADDLNPLAETMRSDNTGGVADRLGAVEEHARCGRDGGQYRAQQIPATPPDIHDSLEPGKIVVAHHVGDTPGGILAQARRKEGFLFGMRLVEIPDIHAEGASCR